MTVAGARSRCPTGATAVAAAGCSCRAASRPAMSCARCLAGPRQRSDCSLGGATATLVQSGSRAADVGAGERAAPSSSVRCRLSPTATAGDMPLLPPPGMPPPQFPPPIISPHAPMQPIGPPMLPMPPPMPAQPKRDDANRQHGWRLAPGFGREGWGLYGGATALWCHS